MKCFHIVAVVGSRNQNSFTERLTEALLQVICEKQEGYTYQIVPLRKWELAYCGGCAQCFCKGYCTLDQRDGFDRLRALLVSADCLVFASPVYMHDVPGVMKTFIDRLAYSTHLLQYAGRLGFTITTTSASGAEFVSSYLRKIQDTLGIKNLCNFSYISSNDRWDNFLEESAGKIITRLNNTFSFSSNLLEEEFEFYKDANKKLCELYKEDSAISSMPVSEIEYWTKDWVSECRSFQEFAVKNKALNSQKNGETE